INYGLGLVLFRQYKKTYQESQYPAGQCKNSDERAPGIKNAKGLKCFFFFFLKRTHRQVIFSESNKSLLTRLSFLQNLVMRYLNPLVSEIKKPAVLPEVQALVFKCKYP